MIKCRCKRHPIAEGSKPKPLPVFDTMEEAVTYHTIEHLKRYDRKMHLQYDNHAWKPILGKMLGLGGKEYRKNVQTLMEMVRNEFVWRLTYGCYTCYEVNDVMHNIQGVVYCINHKPMGEGGTA